MSLDWVQWPVVIKMNPNMLSVNGVEITYMQLAQLVNEFTHPNPRKWIRLERIGDCIHITVRITEGEPDGTSLGTIGNGEADHGGQGQAAAHPTPSHPQDS